MIDEMAANSLQAEEKAKLILQNQKEKYQIEFERMEKENNDLKVRMNIEKHLSRINIFFFF